MGDPPHSLESARAAYAERAWSDAAAHFAAARATAPDDLEQWATAAGLSGDDETMLSLNERLYRELHDVDDARAAKAAFWAGFRLLMTGEVAKGSGWLQRAQRLVDRTPCVVAGYLLLPLIGQKLRARAFDDAYGTAESAAALGEKFTDGDLVAIARHQQGRIRLRQDRIAEGLALLDETMLAATNGELSPQATGIVYCGAIAACRSVYALDRAREWTASLSGWCEAQPQLAPFSGACSIFRAELLELGGSWAEAIDEIARIGAYQVRAEPGSVADARYREGEIHRLRGAQAEAEAAFHAASEHGRDPQPGYALLRLAQGKNDAALTAIRRALDSQTESLDRVRLLPAFIEIALANGSVEDARNACAELEAIALRCDTSALKAIAEEARAGVELASDPAAALRRLRSAFATWQRVGAPYNAARARVLMARACTALGDADGAELEAKAARAVFERLGVAQRAEGKDGLSGREVQVLRLVATGKSNKEIAAELILSVKTVDRHLSNIFVKIGVGSRAAATAYAYEHDLMG